MVQGNRKRFKASKVCLQYNILDLQYAEYIYIIYFSFPVLNAW